MYTFAVMLPRFVVYAPLTGALLVMSESAGQQGPRTDQIQALERIAVESNPGETRVGTTRRTVTRTIDGDTLELEGGEQVRLLGVDTPETVHPRPDEYFGEEASEFSSRLIEGRQVYLEYEGDATKDRYGRTLAYVYLEDGTLINREIIARGYGRAYTRFPFSKADDFLEAEREARNSGRGLWARVDNTNSEELDAAGATGTSSPLNPPSVGALVPAPSDRGLHSSLRPAHSQDHENRRLDVNRQRITHPSIPATHPRNLSLDHGLTAFLYIGMMLR